MALVIDLYDSESGAQKRFVAQSNLLEDKPFLKGFGADLFLQFSKEVEEKRREDVSSQ